MPAAARVDKAGKTVLYTWALTTDDPTGDDITHPGSDDRSVQFVANTAGGATVILEGCNEEEPVNWFTLTDGQGNAISFTASGGEMVMENCLHYRTRLSVAGSGAVWDVLLFSRSTMRS